MKSKPIVKKAIQRIESDIDAITSQNKDQASDEQPTQAERVEKLKKIATSLEDIDNSVDSLMEQQAQKKGKKQK